MKTSRRAFFATIAAAIATVKAGASRLVGVASSKPKLDTGWHQIGVDWLEAAFLPEDEGLYRSALEGRIAFHAKGRKVEFKALPIPAGVDVGYNFEWSPSLPIVRRVRVYDPIGSGTIVRHDVLVRFV